MSRPDSAASAALDAQVIRPVFFGFLDFVCDPLRACTAGRSYTFTGLPDADLNATFNGIDPRVVDIGPVRQKDGGSEAVKAKLSGLVGMDDALLAIVGDRLKWQGRAARLWRMIRDASGTQQGAIQHYFTGYMVDLAIDPDPASQTIEITIEGYLAAHSEASNRSYLDQAGFDPGDLSAKAAVAIANGTSGNPALASTPVPGAGGGGGGGRFYFENTVDFQ